MKKLLLLLTLLVGCGGLLHSAELQFQFNSATLGKTNTTYVTTAFDFTTGGITFNTNQINPSSGQVKVNQGSTSNPSGNFYLYNKTELPNISKIEITMSGIAADKANLASIRTADAAITTSALGSDKGSVSGSTLTLVPSDRTKGFFRIDLAKIGGTVKFQTIKIYYGETGPVAYECADFTDKNLETGAKLQLNLGSHPESLAFTSSNPAVATISNDGEIAAIAPGTTTITAKWDGDAENFTAGEASFNVTVEKPVPGITETISRASFTTTTNGSAYTTYTYTSKETGITYSATFIAKSYMQFNSKSNSGIVVTANPKGYKLKKISIKYNSTPKQIDFYGKDAAYTATSNLYATAEVTLGTKLGSLSNDGTLNISDPCQFFGLRSNSGATYLDSVTLTWELAENEPEDYTGLADINVPTLSAGDTFQLPLGEKYPAEMIFVSDNENVITVDDNGLITAVAPGTATVHAEWDADETNNFTAGSASITVTVSKPLAECSMSFLHHIVYGKLGVGVVGQAAYYNGDGIITYTSSDETILKVNPATGMITKADVLRTGEVTVTASAPATTNYKAATASYTIVVQDPDATDSFESNDATFKFDEEEAYGMFLFNSINCTINNVEIYETDVTSVTNGPVTLTIDGDFRHFEGTNSNYHLRTYQNSNMTFSVPEGYFITKITINQTRGTYTALTAPGSDVTTGTVTYGSSNTLAAWEADSDVSSVTLRGDAAHSRINTMTVVFKKMTSEQDPARLSFTTTCYNDLVNTPVTVNAVNNPNNVPVAYSIDQLTEGTDYTIAEDGENLIVNVNKTGVYTLRAKSNATDHFLPGIAIMRLNIFPPVELRLDNGKEIELTDEGEIVLPAEGGNFTIEGNPFNTVRILYSLNGEAEQLYDGTPIEFTDDATLTYHLEYAETDRYRYTTNSTVVVTPPAPVCNVEHEGTIPSEGIIFTSKEGTTLLYRINVETSAMRAPAATAGWDSNGTNSLTYITPAELEAGTRVTITTKALHSNGRIESETTARAYTVGNDTVTGIESVATDNAGAEAEYFNLQGVRVANPSNGIFIRRQGDNVSKVEVK